jgi:general secretion pathway protein D
MEVPLLSDKETRAESEIVTDVYRVKNSSAAQLVPILRPLLPQYGHLAADVCSNMLIIVDTYANVRRVEAVVQRLDVGEPFKPQACDPRPGGSPPRDAPPK